MVSLHMDVDRATFHYTDVHVEGGAAYQLEQGLGDPAGQAVAHASGSGCGERQRRCPGVARRAAGRGAAPEHDALERGADAMEAGRLDDAEREFRAVAATADTELAGTAHGLVGRVLEDRGDMPGAEEQYHLGDALGDGEAANDVGLILQARGQIAEAQEAYRRRRGARQRAGRVQPGARCTTSAARTTRPPPPSRAPTPLATRRPPSPP